MTDQYPTQPFPALPRPIPDEYHPYPPYPPPPPPPAERSPWLAVLAVTLVAALFGIGVLGALLFDARNDLAATKTTLAETRAVGGQTSADVATLRQQLAASQDALNAERAKASALQSDASRLRKAVSDNTVAAKQQERRIKDLTQCGEGYLQMYSARTAQVRAWENNVDPSAAISEIETTWDTIRGACERVQLTAEATP